MLKLVQLTTNEVGEIVESLEGDGDEQIHERCVAVEK